MSGFAVENIETTFVTLSVDDGLSAGIDWGYYVDPGLLTKSIGEKHSRQSPSDDSDKSDDTVECSDPEKPRASNLSSPSLWLKTPTWQKQRQLPPTGDKYLLEGDFGNGRDNAGDTATTNHQLLWENLYMQQQKKKATKQHESGVDTTLVYAPSDASKPVSPNTFENSSDSSGDEMFDMDP